MTIDRRGLQLFIFLLARDHVPFGLVESLLLKSRPTDVRYDDEHLPAWAAIAAEILVPDQVVDLGKASIDVSTALRKMILKFKFTGKRRAFARIAMAGWILRLAGRVAGCQVTVTDETTSA